VGRGATELVRGSQFVASGKIMTAGGLTSGIDLALHVVEQFYGRAVALATATYMEYESRRWMGEG
jgi:transcriptional regulator GlxA family with amidase domain